jgi:hypothetical protein
MSSAKLPDSIREQLTKILRLAESGVAGERDNARRLLDRLAAKHKIPVESLVSPEKSWVKLNYNDAHEHRLLVQVVCHVLGKGRFDAKKLFRAFEVELTEAETIDVRACFKHYRALYRQGLDDYFSAFCARNEIYSGEETDGEPLDPEKLARLLAMVAGLKKNQWKRPVAALNAPAE